MLVLHTALDYTLLALGLGFVIFFHELGHFLAAKYCDVKVEQFAVGFGPAIVAWRKGLGFHWGTTTPAYDQIIEQNVAAEQPGATQQKEIEYKSPISQAQAKAIGDKLGIGETEYRLNWIPLGGYVKMLGQDDLKPGVTVEDPRAYNNKSVGARMVIVSAGVVMNVILAAIGFMIIFMMGYPVPPAVVGGSVSMSPAARATRADGTQVGLQPGDAIIQYNDQWTYGDYSRIQLDVALTRDGTRVPILVRHPDGHEETLYATPEKPADGNGLVELGITQPISMTALAADSEEPTDYALLAKTNLPDLGALRPGDSITQIAGQDVKTNGDAAIAQLYAAMEASDGKPVDLTVKSADGKISHKTVTPHFCDPMIGGELNFLGMIPRATVIGLLDKSPALNKIKPGDTILAVDGGTDHLQNPTLEQIRSTLSAAGDKELKVSLTVLDPGQSKPRVAEDLTPYHLPDGGGRMGLGIALGCDEMHLVVARTMADSPAAGKIRAGSTLTAIDGKPIHNWFDVRRVIASAKAGQNISITFIPADQDAKPAVARIELRRQDIDLAKQVTLTQYLALGSMVSALHTHNPLVALKWGVIETRDLILTFYVTLQRMLTRDVALSNVMGPVGLAHVGAQVASKGIAWLIWFLCTISANLAVVNFLPIPVVDGGLFTLLILEKIQGKPLSSDVQRIVQMVGLVLILGVFLLVTYQDFARMAGY
ncbi:MAG TPA: site-2 protease family protein [Tepidisphaeraceae bacterium]|nr:site-2 protease family protein [Tepidisphaeraceae bacterium]